MEMPEPFNQRSTYDLQWVSQCAWLSSCTRSESRLDSGTYSGYHLYDTTCCNACYTFTVQSRFFSIHPIHRINTTFSVKFVSLFFWQVPGNTCQRMLFWCCLPSARLFADAALLENFRLLDGRFKIRTLLLSATFTSKHHI